MIKQRKQTMNSSVDEICADVNEMTKKYKAMGDMWDLLDGKGPFYVITARSLEDKIHFKGWVSEAKVDGVFTKINALLQAKVTNPNDMPFIVKGRVTKNDFDFDRHYGNDISVDKDLDKKCEKFVSTILEYIEINKI